MKYSFEPITLDADSFSAESGVPRSEGVHLSTVLDYVYRKSGMVKYREMDESTKQALWTAGFLWEDIFAERMARSSERASMIIRPGEQVWCVECGVGFPSTPATAREESSWAQHKASPNSAQIRHTGIFLTPDGVNISEQEWAVEEYKVTWMSARQIVINGQALHDQIHKYVWQGMSYCKALSLTRLNITVFFINNCYAPPLPQPYRFSYEFTQKEIDDNWKNIVLANLRGAMAERDQQEV
jgi:hypothetical protein